MALCDLPIGVLGDCIEQLCSGYSVGQVGADVRERLTCSGYSPNPNLDQDLLSLELSVRAYAAANLANIRKEVLHGDISSATKKCYEAILTGGSATRREEHQAIINSVRASEVLARVGNDIIERLETLTVFERKFLVVFAGSRQDLALLIRAITQGYRIACQEAWLNRCGEPSCDEQQKNSDLGPMIDASMRFAEARRVITLVLNRTFAALDRLALAEKIIFKPSAAGRRNLGLLIRLSKELRILELNRAVWRLKYMGRNVPPRSVQALRAGNIVSLREDDWLGRRS